MNRSLSIILVTVLSFQNLPLLFADETSYMDKNRQAQIAPEALPSNLADQREQNSQAVVDNRNTVTELSDGQVAEPRRGGDSVVLDEPVNPPVLYPEGWEQFSENTKKAWLAMQTAKQAAEDAKIRAAAALDALNQAEKDLSRVTDEEQVARDRWRAAKLAYDAAKSKLDVAINAYEDAEAKGADWKTLSLLLGEVFEVYDLWRGPRDAYQAQNLSYQEVLNKKAAAQNAYNQKTQARVSAVSDWVDALRELQEATKNYEKAVQEDLSKVVRIDLYYPVDAYYNSNITIEIGVGFAKIDDLVRTRQATVSPVVDLKTGVITYPPIFTSPGSSVKPGDSNYASALARMIGIVEHAINLSNSNTEKQQLNDLLVKLNQFVQPAIEYTPGSKITDFTIKDGSVVVVSRTGAIIVVAGLPGDNNQYEINLSGPRVVTQIDSTGTRTVLSGQSSGSAIGLSQLIGKLMAKVQDTAMIAQNANLVDAVNRLQLAENGLTDFYYDRHLNYGYKALKALDQNNDASISSQEAQDGYEKIGNMVVGLVPLDIKFDLNNDGEVDGGDFTRLGIVLKEMGLFQKSQNIQAFETKYVDGLGQKFTVNAQSENGMLTVKVQVDDPIYTSSFSVLFTFNLSDGSVTKATRMTSGSVVTNSSRPGTLDFLEGYLSPLKKTLSDMAAFETNPESLSKIAAIKILADSLESKGVYKSVRYLTAFEQRTIWISIGDGFAQVIDSNINHPQAFTYGGGKEGDGPDEFNFSTGVLTMPGVGYTDVLKPGDVDYQKRLQKNIQIVEHAIQLSQSGDKVLLQDVLLKMKVFSSEDVVAAATADSKSKIEVVVYDAPVIEAQVHEPLAIGNNLEAPAVVEDPVAYEPAPVYFESLRQEDAFFDSAMDPERQLMRKYRWGVAAD